MKRSRLLGRLLGPLLGAAGLAFLARTIYVHRSDVGDALRHANTGWLVGALVLGAIGMTVIAAVWGAVLRAVGAPFQLRRAIALYFRGEVAKYVPGGVWSVVGRGELARRDGVPGPTAYASVLLSLVTLYMSCAAVAAILWPFGIHEAFGAMVAIAVVAVGIAVLHPRFLKRALDVVRRLTKRELEVAVPGWGTSIRFLFLYAPAWFAIGTSTWAVVQALGGDAGWPQTMVATTLSWLVGFLAVPVPGGIGIREAVFVGALPALDPGTAAAAALAARILFMLVDGGGALVSSVSMGVAGRNEA